MTTLEGIVCFSVILVFFIVGWFLPRKLGILGFLSAHISISILVVALILFDIIRGVVSDPDFIWMIGNFIWVALANMMLLPLSIFASYRHFLSKRQSNPSL